MMLQLLLGGLAALTLHLANASPVERRTTLPSSANSKHLRPVLERRDSPGFAQGQPYDGKGKGAPLVGTRDITAKSEWQETDVSRWNQQSARFAKPRQPWSAVDR